MTVVKITGRHPMAEELGGYTTAHGRKAKASEGEAMLAPCPFCGGPAVNVGMEYITCGAAWKHDCAGHQLRCLPCDWNTRAPPQSVGNPLTARTPDIEDLAQFLCSELALEPFDELSRTKYLSDADAIFAFLSLPAEGLAREADIVSNAVRQALWPLDDRQLWENSCITRAQIRCWADEDIAKHAAGMRHTVQFLLARLDALAALQSVEQGAPTSVSASVKP
jgi:hypothetical protein